MTLQGALSDTGLEAVMTIEGATDAAVFHVDVQEVLCPTRREGDIAVADNLAAHTAAGVQEAIVAPGVRRCACGSPLVAMFYTKLKTARGLQP